MIESSSFVDLERFENKGLISLQDGGVGDVFRISNVPPPVSQDSNSGLYFFNSGIAFNGSGQSALAVDSFLGKPGSESDILIIDGDVTGKTKVKVNNINPGPDVFNPDGIPVVYVGGNVKSDAFFLGNPIDTGFFDLRFVLQAYGKRHL